MTDPLGDMLTRIRNGQRARQVLCVGAGFSLLREQRAGVLEREGYIRGYERTNVRQGIDELRIELKYMDGEPVIREIQRYRRRDAGFIQGQRSAQCLQRPGHFDPVHPRGVMSDRKPGPPM